MNFSRQMDKSVSFLGCLCHLPFRSLLLCLHRVGKTQLKTVKSNLTESLLHLARLRSEWKGKLLLQSNFISSQISIKFHFLTNFRGFVKSGCQCPLLRLQRQVLTTTSKGSLAKLERQDRSIMGVGGHYCE